MSPGGLFLSTIFMLCACIVMGVNAILAIGAMIEYTKTQKETTKQSAMFYAGFAGFMLFSIILQFFGLLSDVIRIHAN